MSATRTWINFGRYATKSDVFVRYEQSVGEFSLSSSCHPWATVRVVRDEKDSLPQCMKCGRRIDNYFVRDANIGYVDAWTWDEHTAPENVQAWAAAWMGLDEDDLEVKVTY